MSGTDWETWAKCGLRYLWHVRVPLVEEVARRSPLRVLVLT
ncbi:hypothetical protein [Thalassobaculum sp.]